MARKRNDVFMGQLPEEVRRAIDLRKRDMNGTAEEAPLERGGQDPAETMIASPERADELRAEAARLAKEADVRATEEARARIAGVGRQDVRQISPEDMAGIRKAVRGEIAAREADEYQRKIEGRWLKKLRDFLNGRK